MGLFFCSYICFVAKRTQPYRLGIPSKYFTGKAGSGSDKDHADKVKKRAKAYEEGKRVDFSSVMKKGGKVARKALSASVKKTLQAKAKKSGISYGKLSKVYRRGQGAWMSGGSRKGIGMAQWAMGRVNSFIRGSRKHDTDLR